MLKAVNDLAHHTEIRLFYKGQSEGDFGRRLA